MQASISINSDNIDKIQETIAEIRLSFANDMTRVDNCTETLSDEIK